MIGKTTESMYATVHSAMSTLRQAVERDQKWSKTKRIFENEN